MVTPIPPEVRTHIAGNDELSLTNPTTEPGRSRDYYVGSHAAATRVHTH